MLLTVRKIGPVLDLFTVDRPEWGVTEVAEMLDMPKSSVHALMSTLVEIGLLTYTSHSRYRLGWRFLDLGETLRASLDIRAAAVPVMRELVKQTRETVQLGVLDRYKVLYVDRVEGTYPVRFSGAPVGARLPAHCSALGKCMLAHRPIGEVRRAAEIEGLKALTRNTITSFDRLLEELDMVRRQGFAYDNEEAIRDVSCVGAPIFEANGLVVAALSFTAPTWRFRTERDELRSAIVSAAAEVTSALSLSTFDKPLHRSGSLRHVASR